MSETGKINAGDWRDRTNVQRALREARRLYLAVRAGALDATKVLPQLVDAAEPLWDHPDGDPALVLKVVRSMQPHFSAAVAENGLKDPERLRMRVEPAILLMRAQIRVPGQEREALLTGLSVLTFLENVAGGHDALVDVMGRATPNAVAEAAVAVLGGLPAALRRAALPRPVHAQYRGIVIRLVQAYVGDSGPKVVYPRTAALAAQTFYLCVADRRQGEESLVRALYALDLATRPQDLRGQATRAQRDAEYARYCGDTAGFVRNRAEALQDLRRFELKRHLEALQRYGYFAS